MVRLINRTHLSSLLLSGLKKSPDSCSRGIIWFHVSLFLFFLFSQASQETCYDHVSTDVGCGYRQGQTANIFGSFFFSFFFLWISLFPVISRLLCDYLLSFFSSLPACWIVVFVLVFLCSFHVSILDVSLKNKKKRKLEIQHRVNHPSKFWVLMTHSEVWSLAYTLLWSLCLVRWTRPVVWVEIHRLISCFIIDVFFILIDYLFLLIPLLSIPRFNFRHPCCEHY